VPAAASAAASVLEPGLSGAAARAALEIITWLSSIEAVVLSRRSMRGTSSVHLRLSSAGPSELDRRGFRVNGPVLVVVDAVDVDASGGGGESSVGDDDVAELGGCVLVAEAEADAEAVLSRGGVVVTASTTDDDAGDDDVTVIETAAAAMVTESADESFSSSAASFFVGEALMRTRAGDD
jgi:hypothetical protein